MDDLPQKHCVPCEGGTPPLGSKEIDELLPQVDGWILGEGKKITREFIFKTFVRAVEFVNAVADIAEMEDHHPDFHIYYNRVRLELWTHAIGGLSENDFVVAAKINQMMAVRVKGRL